MDTWALIRAMSKSENLSQREIARRLGVSRQTVSRALARDTAPKYVRASTGSMTDEYVPAMRAILTEFPRMPATVVAQRVGFPRQHSSVFRARVAQLKAELAVADRS